MNYQIVIPTHNRVDVIQKKSLPLLKQLGVPAARITLVVSNAEQRDAYREGVPKELYGELLMLPSKGIGDVKNAITRHYPAGKPLVIFEDDIRDLRQMSADGKKLVSVKSLGPIITEGFRLCKQQKTILWGIYAVPNAFFMKKEVSFDLKFVIGTCYGILNDKSIVLKTNVKEDYELSLITWRKYGAIVRFNNIVAMRKAYPDRGQGGLDDLKERKARTEVSVDYLLKEYPDLVYESKKTKLGLREIQMKRLKKEAEEVKGSGIAEDKRYINSKTPYTIAKEMSAGQIKAYAADPEVPPSMKDKLAAAVELKGGTTTTAIKPQDLPEEEYSSTRIVRLPIRNRTRYVAAREKLLNALNDITVSKIAKPDFRPGGTSNRGNVIGTIGRTMTFGFGDNRHGWNYYATNKKHPEVFKALVEFGNAVVPKGWKYQGLTLNHGVKAKKHKDSKNCGESVLVGIGDYTGGEIRVWDGNDANPRDFATRDHPVMFNGGNLFHETQPFKGDRYTIIFYKQKKRPVRGEIGIGRGSESPAPKALSQPEPGESGIYA
jgi:hypothetical protein